MLGDLGRADQVLSQRQVSIPSSSGHVMGDMAVTCPCGHRRQVSIPSSSGHVGRLSNPAVSLQTRDRQFQSPLHRGMFGRHRNCRRQRHDRDTCFNPLFIGACWATDRAQRRLRCHDGGVSIPSSSGHVGRLGGSDGDGCQLMRFNPLFIGACWATARSADGILDAADCRFQSPLHRGMLGDDCRHLMRSRDRRNRFQSPLHRGMLGDCHDPGMDQGTRRSGFNPLFIGACWATLLGNRSRKDSRSFNPLFIGACHGRPGTPAGIVARLAGFNPLFIGACHRATVHLTEQRTVQAQFQSPLHRGMYGRPGPTGNRPRQCQRFNPLFIGACIGRPGAPVVAVHDRLTRFNPLFIGACMGDPQARTGNG